MRSASARTARRARPSRSGRCRAGAASRSSASPFVGEQGGVAASAARDRHLPRPLDRGAAVPRVRRRPAALRGVFGVRPGRRRRTVTSAPQTVRVVGTAGHVDHGKSTLIRALTGIDPDRLREERERGMTIDLGFAWLTTPNGTDVGFVDVPGHQDFIRNMLAGVGSIDAVVLVIACDEGVRPQTREHLAILSLLGIQRGVVALAKRDLIDDEWAELVRGEVRTSLAGTPLSDAPIVEVSAAAGTGGDEVELVPGGARARIRGLQTHRRAIERAIPGSRVAANLAGVDRDAVERGM